MGTEDAYKIIPVGDLPLYSGYYMVRRSLDDTQCVLEFIDPTGVAGVQSNLEVLTYMYADYDNWIDDPIVL